MKESILNFPANKVITYLSDGIYKAGKRDSYTLLNDVEVRNGIIINIFTLKGRMIWGQSYLEKEMAKGTQIIIKGDSFVPYTKKGGDSIMSPTKIIPNTFVGDILSANAEFSKLFENKVFSYPKPLTLIQYLIKYFEEKDFYILDFFSGSATTANAVLKLNSEDGGKRKFIMVQLPESLDENFLKASDKEKVTITNAIKLCDEYGLPRKLTEIGKERIRRAGAKIKEENKDKEGIENLDIGFRVLKLDSTNMKDVYYNPEEYNYNIFDRLTDNIKEDRTPEDLLFQVMLDLGVLLSSKIEENTLDGKKVFNVADGFLIACFDENVTEQTIKAIAQQKPYYFVMRDSSMANDSVATNFEQIFATYSPGTVRKVL